MRFHQLRHFYANALIHAGENVKTIQAALGHASAVETLQIYLGLWPEHQARTRAAIDTLNRAKHTHEPPEQQRMNRSRSRVP